MFKKKKYLEYTFKDDKLNLSNNATKIIVDILSPATAKSSCWWSSLKSNIGGWKSNLEFISHHQKENIKNHTNNVLGGIRTVKSCPGISGMFRNSYLIKSPADLSITITKNGQFVWNSSNDLIRISDDHPREQFVTDEGDLFKNKIAIKFEFDIEIKTPDIPYIYIQPMYHNNIWFDVATGTIKPPYTKGIPLSVIAFVDLPEDKEITHHINFGDVLSYIWFPEKLELRQSPDNFYITNFRKRWEVKHNFK
jgi:hypothetical protein